MIVKMVCICSKAFITKGNVYKVETKTDFVKVFSVLSDSGRWLYYTEEFFEPLRKNNLKKILWHLEQDI